jgi:hypothetical protein
MHIYGHGQNLGPCLISRLIRRQASLDTPPFRKSDNSESYARIAVTESSSDRHFPISARFMQPLTRSPIHNSRKGKALRVIGTAPQVRLHDSELYSASSSYLVQSSDLDSQSELAMSPGWKRCASYAYIRLCITGGASVAPGFGIFFTKGSLRGFRPLDIEIRPRRPWASLSSFCLYSPVSYSGFIMH